ncbi:Putative competence-damage inducible protein [Stutzerimonas stutzeri]
MQRLEEVVAFLRDRQLVLSTAESCTCGLMASLLGDIPGCGQVLDSGFVVYSPAAKHRLLQVSFATIERFGLTSEEVATEMATGALHASTASLAWPTPALPTMPRRTRAAPSVSPLGAARG